MHSQDTTSDMAAEIRELKDEFEKLLECLNVDRVVTNVATGNQSEPFYRVTKFKWVFR